MGSGGVFSKALTELIESGFVSQNPDFGKKTKFSLYSLSDEYSGFYLKFIEPNKIQGSGTWARLSQKQTYKSWSGFAFEVICRKHIANIKKALGVMNVYAFYSGWYHENAQVDLLIDRDDGIINLCEMKFHNGPFTINKTTYHNLRNKIFEFRSSTKTRKNVFLTMITTYGVTVNANSLELLTDNLTMDCLFEKV